MRAWEWLGVPAWVAGVVAGVALLALVAAVRRRLRVREIEVSFLPLWMGLRDARASSRLRRSSLPLWLTALGVLFSLLAALAPWPQPSRERGKHVLLLVDEWALQTPASTASVRQAIRDSVGRLRLDDRLALWSFDETPRVLMGWQRDKAALAQALAQLAPRAHTPRTSVAPVIRRNAQRALAEAATYVASDGEIVLVGPHEFSAVISADNVRWLQAGAAPNNVAIESVSAQSQDTRTQVALHVRNQSTRGCRSRVAIDDDQGQTKWQAEVDLAPAAPQGFAVTLNAGRLMRLRAHIASACDEVPQDNAIVLNLPAAPPKHVRLFGKPNAFFSQAFRALPYPVVLADHTKATSISTQAELQSSDLVIFNEVAPPSLPLQGHFVHFSPTPEASPWPTSGVAIANHQIIAATNEALWRDVSLTDVMWRQLLRVRPPPEAVPLATANGHVVAATLTRSGFSQTVFGFSLRETDLPWHAAFPLLLDNLLAAASPFTVQAFAARDLVDVEKPAPAKAWQRVHASVPFGTNLSKLAAAAALLCAAILFLGLRQGLGALASHRRLRWLWRGLVLVSLVVAVLLPQPTRLNTPPARPLPPAPTLPSPDLMLKSLIGPTMLAANERFEVRVPVLATAAGVAILQVEQDGISASDIAGARSTSGGWLVKVAPGTTWVTATFSAPQAQSQTRIVARLVHGAGSAWRPGLHNEATIIIPMRAAPRLLLVTETPNADPLARALRAQGFSVTATTPSRAPLPQEWSAIVLNNVPLASLPRGWSEGAANAVKSGCGLLVATGGNLNFKAAWARNALQTLLPADLEEPAQRPVADLATVLVVDRSASMGGSKLALTLEAVKAATTAMRPTDQIAVVAFDSRVETIVPLQSAANRPRILAQMERLSAGGGTNLMPALRQAYQTLLGAEAKRKHVVVLSDGHTPTAGLQELLGNLTGANITISTVALGSGADAGFLRRLADTGGGRSHTTDDPARVPRIFANEIFAVSAVPQPKALLRIKSTHPNNRTQGVNWQRAPGLGDVAHVRPRIGSQTLLALTSGEAVLVGGMAGTGQVWLWAADVAGPWAAAWPAWEGFAVFWSQLVRSLAEGHTANVQPILVSPAGVAKVTFGSSPPAIAQQGHLLVRGQGHVTTLGLWETSPGTYETQLPTSPVRGQTAAVLEAKFDQAAVGSGLGHTSWDPVTSGQNAHPAPRVAPQVPPYETVGPWFAALAALLFVAEIPRRRATFRASKS